MQDITINDKHATFSEALFMAGRHAREEVHQRALMQQRLAEKGEDPERGASPVTSTTGAGRTVEGRTTRFARIAGFKIEVAQQQRLRLGIWQR